MVKKHWRIQYPWFKSILSHNNSWLFSSLLYSLWMLMEALCWKLLTRSTFVCGSSHANGPTTLENTVTRSSSFRTRFRPFTPRLTKLYAPGDPSAVSLHIWWRKSYLFLLEIVPKKLKMSEITLGQITPLLHTGTRGSSILLSQVGIWLPCSKKVPKYLGRWEKNLGGSLIEQFPALC